MSEPSLLNSKSIISLTLGIVSLLLPLVGLITAIGGIVTSIASFREINYTGERGKGVATSGLICSIVAIFLQVFVVIAFVSFYNFISYQI